MNYKQEQLRYDEIDFSFKRIIGACIKSLKWILVCACACAVMLPCLMYIKDSSAYKNSLQEMNGISIDNLTDVEQRGVEYFILLKEKEAQLKSYEENSPIMQMNCTDVYEGKIQFLIEANGYEIEDITSININMLSSDNFYKQFAQEVGFTEHAYVDELFTISDAKDNNGVFLVSVKAKSENECKEYMEALKKLAFENSKSLQKLVKQHEIKVVQEEIGNGYENDVYVVQKTHYQMVNEIRAELKTQTSYLTTAQKVIIADAIEDTEELLPDENTKPSIRLVYILIGIIGGAVIGVVLVVAKVLLSGKLQTEIELSKRFGISCLGVIKSLNNETEIESQMGDLSLRIENILKQIDSKEVYMIGTTDSVSSDYMTKLYAMLAKEDICCKPVVNILTESHAVNQILEKNVIMLEVVSKSKVKDIYKIATTCNDVRANVIGYICIEP